ncbi:hypothetical protein HWV62_12216 [Athelia sp. TMB]|nr:hypothetical protein HWV62_12216 [Athelia sp. TMB]
MPCACKSKTVVDKDENTDDEINISTSFPEEDQYLEVKHRSGSKEVQAVPSVKVNVMGSGVELGGVGWKKHSDDDHLCQISLHPAKRTIENHPTYLRWNFKDEKGVFYPQNVKLLVVVEKCTDDPRPWFPFQLTLDWKLRVDVHGKVIKQKIRRFVAAQSKHDGWRFEIKGLYNPQLAEEAWTDAHENKIPTHVGLHPAAKAWLEARTPSMKPSTGPTDNAYERWTKDELIARLRDLDGHLRKTYPGGKELNQPTVPVKEFDFSAHPVRKIALKFCYSGSEYCGLAYQKNQPTPLPTVEEVLFQALAKVRLVDPAANFDGCGWERCGRTDRGVSAAGQVVSLWVRSAIGAEKSEALALEQAANSEPAIPALEGGLMDETQEPNETNDFPEPSLLDSALNAARPRPEFHYIQLLNRVLPPTIRVIAWSPVAPSFSSRFNCRQRHYKYFFTSQGLDLSLMRDGAERLIGEHDFRNMCKLDPAKQITSFHRGILRAEISPVPDVKDLYVFDLVGTAFLYHQVRHIMAILFLVGTGLEHPSIVSSLLNVHPNNLPTPLLVREGDPPLALVDRKPEYQMADGLPLMLWDCSYAENDVQWRTTPDDSPSSAKPGQGSGSELYDQMQSIHSRSTVHTALDAHFKSAVAVYHPPGPAYFPLNQNPCKIPSILQLPLGGGMTKREGTYKPILLRKRQESVEVINEKWRLGKGERLEKRLLAAIVDDE